MNRMRVVLKASGYGIPENCAGSVPDRQRSQQKVVATRIVQAHRDRSIRRRNHEGACRDSVALEAASAHEVVNEE
jgi:hypothetical protein